MKRPERILVIRRDNIGDLVCTTPLFTALRSHFPGARVDALVNSYNQPVLAGNPEVDRVYAYTKAKHREEGENLLQVYWRRLRLLWTLRRERYDLAILANDGDTPRALKLARWIAPRHIAGFIECGKALAGIDLAIECSDVPMHASEIAFRLLAPLGIEGVPPPLRLYPDIGLLHGAQARLSSAAWYRPESPMVAVHISARKIPQRWPIERYAELMRRLHAARGVQFLLFWAPGDENNPLHPGDDRKADALLRSVADLPVLPCPTQKLEELIAGIAVGDAMICSDGGAMHIAAGLGKPILCFFGNSDAVRWRPWGVTYRLLQKPSESVLDISVDEAFEASEILFGPHPA